MPVYGNAMTQPSPKPYIQSLPAYHVAEGGDLTGKLIRLSFNEGAFGPSPAAVAAFQAAVPGMHRYPEMSYRALRAALAQTHNIDAGRIMCGAGSDDLLIFLARAYAGVGDEIIYSQYGFAMYAIATKSVGATSVVVPEKNLTLDINGVLAAVTPRTKLVFIANPNNPTGSYVDKDAIRRLHAGLPKDVLLVLDAAYAEYITVQDYSDGMELAEQAPNVIILRTFSKIHALGGLRIGWGYGAASIIEALNKVRNPFNIATPSAMAAIASLEDREFLARSRAHNEHWRTWLSAELRAINSFTPHPAAANFILVGVGSPERAKALLACMRENNIQLRSMNNYKLPDHVRITIGREEEMLAVVDALKQFRAGES